MTDDQRNAKQRLAGDEQSTGMTKKSKSAKRGEKKRLSQIREREETVPPGESRTDKQLEQGTVAGTEYDEQDDGASSKATSERSVMEEGTDDLEEDTGSPEIQQYPYNYANPTKASEAKKNEKIELASGLKRVPTLKQPTSRPGTAMQRQRSESVLGSRRQSPRRKGSVSGLGYQIDDEASDRSASSSVTSRKGKGHRRTRSRSLTNADVAHANQDKLWIGRWQQKVEEGGGEPPVQEEAPKTRIEELMEQRAKKIRKKSAVEMDSEAPLREASLEFYSTCIAKLDEQIESERRDTGVENKSDKPKDNPDVVLGMVVEQKEQLEMELKTAEKERDGLTKRLEAIGAELRACKDQIQEELQTCRDHGEKLRQKNDRLQDDIRELQKQIAESKLRQTGLQPSEAAEAEIKGYRAAIQYLERKVAETSQELKAKEEEEKGMCDAMDEIQDDLTNTKGTLEKLRTYNSTLSGIVKEVSQRVSQGMSTEGMSMDKDLLSKLATKFANKFDGSNPEDIDPSGLHMRLFQLFKCFIDLDGQLAEKDHNISTLEKARAVQEDEYKYLGPMSPALSSPGVMSPGHADRESWERLYKDEHQKRIAADKKLAEVEASAEKARSSRLEQQNQELQTELTAAHEEIAVLRKKADDFETLSKMWQGEAEETKSDLIKRSLNFEKTIAQQQQEVHKHVKEYYDKTQDQAHWEVQGLQKQVAALEAELAATKKTFDQTKSDNESLDSYAKRLARGNSIRDTHIDKIRQAHARGEKLPTLPSIETETNDDAESSASSSSSSFSWLQHPRSLPPAVIPACRLPDAIDRRAARLQEHREHLRQMREKEMLSFTVEAALANKYVRDEIMEKVRKWKLKNKYPPEKKGWDIYKARSAWERWEGAKWIAECTIIRKDLQVLKDRGLWRDG
jgi:hypothetical protein